MTLAEFTQLSVGIAATLFSLVLILVLISGFAIYRRLSRIVNRLDTVSQTALATSETVKSFVDRTTNELTAFTRSLITLQGAKELIGYIGEGIKKAKEQRKETSHGKSD